MPILPIDAPATKRSRKCPLSDTTMVAVQTTTSAQNATASRLVRNGAAAGRAAGMFGSANGGADRRRLVPFFVTATSLGYGPDNPCPLIPQSVPGPLDYDMVLSAKTFTSRGVTNTCCRRRSSAIDSGPAKVGAQPLARRGQQFEPHVRAGRVDRA